MVNENELAWLAGLLEGEGWFGIHRGSKGHPYPRITLGMTDEDIVARAAKLMDHTYHRLHSSRSVALGHSPIFRCSITGSKAREMMHRLLPYMGERRSARIKEALDE